VQLVCRARHCSTFAAWYGLGVWSLVGGATDRQFRGIWGRLRLYRQLPPAPEILLGPLFGIRLWQPYASYFGGGILFYLNANDRPAYHWQDHGRDIAGAT
jgi:hypothetical protein